MVSKFLNLDSEKQDRIINSAIKEFALKGYEKASTNEIVKEAEISKGLLFHYFKNKKLLFLFLYDYSLEKVTDEVFKKIDFTERDFIARLHQTSLAKLGLLKKYPEMFRFIEVAYMEDASAVHSELEKRKKEFTDLNVGKIYEGIDMSKFRTDMDVQKVLKIITWTFESMGNEAMQKAKSTSQQIDYEEVFADAQEYIELFKKSFYK